MRLVPGENDGGTRGGFAFRLRLSRWRHGDERGGDDECEDAELRWPTREQEAYRIQSVFSAFWPFFVVISISFTVVTLSGRT